MTFRRFLLAALICTALPVHAEERTAHELRALDLFRALIETDTTHSTGGTTRAAQLLADTLIRAGNRKKM